MRSLADFEFNKAPLCDGMILISELIRDDFPSQFVHDELERLIRLAREEISEAQPQDLQLEKLLELFYGEWGLKTPAVCTVCRMRCGWIKSCKTVRVARCHWAPFCYGLPGIWIFR
jgi:hypothetical protein